MKISCIGGAGYYFAGPIRNFAAHPDLRGTELCIYDIDRERADIMAAMARRLSRKGAARLKVSVANSLPRAIEGSDFVLCSIGGAGNTSAGGYSGSTVHLGDKLICNKYGIPQLVGDTCGPAAMMAAFRTIPIYMDICHQIITSHCTHKILILQAHNTVQRISFVPSAFYY